MSGCPAAEVVIATPMGAILVPRMGYPAGEPSHRSSG